MIMLGFLVVGNNLAFAADADCASAGGNCNNTASECSKSGGSIISGGQCTDTAYVCCKAGSSTTTPPASQTTAPATNTASSGSDIPFPNPIKCETMSCFFGNILNALLGVVAFIALIFIIIGAVMYMLSAGDEQAMKRAKKTVTAAVAGFAIAAAAPTFLRTIKDILGGAGGADADAMLNQAYTLKDIAIKVLNLLLSVTGIIAIIGLIVGAIFYLTSYGDEDRMEKGKKILVASIIGIIVAFSALVIVRQVAGLVAAQ